jgi:hypothetical protein
VLNNIRFKIRKFWITRILRKQFIYWKSYSVTTPINEIAGIIEIEDESVYEKMNKNNLWLDQ